MHYFIGSVLMIVIIIQGSKRVKTCWLNYIIGTVLIKALLERRNTFFYYVQHKDNKEWLSPT